MEHINGTVVQIHGKYYRNCKTRIMCTAFGARSTVAHTGAHCWGWCTVARTFRAGAQWRAGAFLSISVFLDFLQAVVQFQEKVLCIQIFLPVRQFT